MISKWLSIIFDSILILRKDCNSPLSFYYFHFWTHSFDKGMNSLILNQLWVKYYYKYYKDRFGIKYSTKVDMLLNKETELNCNVPLAVELILHSFCISLLKRVEVMDIFVISLYCQSVTLMIMLQLSLQDVTCRELVVKEGSHEVEIELGID